jgi:Tfp pilus assembly protein PilF
MSGTRAPSASRASLWLVAALILGFSFACYWPALRGGMLWDDDAHVTRPELRSAAGLWRIWSSPGATQQYYPLLFSAFWVEHRIWGDATLGYHLASLLEHAAAAFLLYRVLRRLGARGAWLAGIVFAVHPVCVESVAWISEQKNTLSLLFYLLAALAYLRFDRDRGERPSGRWYALASVLFMMALLTKSVTATLPAALLVVLWWKRGRISFSKDVVPLVPWFFVAIASGLFTSWVERTLIGAQGADFDLTFTERCLLAGRVVWFYLGKLAWPAHLVFIYPHWDMKAGGLGSAAWLGAALLVSALLWFVRGRSRGPLAAWLFFVGSLFPALGFFNVYPFLFSYVADHFQYLACLGPIAAASAAAVLLIERLPKAQRAVGKGVVAALVATLAILSCAESRTYTDQVTLYTTTISRNPQCWMAHNNLGLWYEGHGDIERALAEYREAIGLKADFAPVHNNLGGLLRRIPGHADEAFAHSLEAVRLRPVFPEAHTNLGVCYEDRGDLPNAVAQFEEALREKPGYATAHNDLGSVLGMIPGRLDEATSHLKEAVRLQPDYAEAHNNLGSAWMSTPGHLDDAIAEYRESLRLNPDVAGVHNNLANALMKRPGQTDEAIAQFEEALRLKPDFGEAHNNLGLALGSKGRDAEAVVHFREAERLMPGFAGVHYNLALALLHTPDGMGEAEQQLEAFLRLVPGNATAERILAQIRARRQ